MEDILKQINQSRNRRVYARSVNRTKFFIKFDGEKKLVTPLTELIEPTLFKEFEVTVA